VTGSARIVRGNALALPLDDSTVDLIVTSPPYFGLRSYQDGGEHYDGQLGSEATPAEFVDALIAATAEMVRVLKPSGSIWVNLGDKYASGGRTSYDRTDINGERGGASRPQDGARPKSLLGIPWRYAIRCIDDLGLILRAEVIWSKPNGLPESVTDRVRRSHEQWFHFTKEPRYFSAVDEIREAHLAPNRSGTNPKHESAPFAVGIPAHTSLSTTQPNPLGKLPGSVWTIPTQPLRVPDHLGIDHFAAFPTEWPRRIIQGWSPRGICVECGEGRRPTSERDPIDPRFLASNKRGDGRGNVEVRGVSQSSILRTGLQAGQSPPTRITGYACACPAPTVEREIREFDHHSGEMVTRVVEVSDPTWQPIAPTTPAVVLDPFGGTGTTALVAKALGRHGISVDMSADYCRLATWRTTDPDQIARAMQVDKPVRQVDGQVDLFDHLEETP
jgi:DNA modification methylase